MNTKDVVIGKTKRQSRLAREPRETFSIKKQNGIPVREFAQRYGHNLDSVIEQLIEIGLPILEHAERMKRAELEKSKKMFLQEKT